MTITVKELKDMEVNQVTDLIEERLGRKLPMVESIQLAMIIGAGEAGVKTYTDLIGRTPPHTETMDWEALAELINGEDDK